MNALTEKQLSELSQKGKIKSLLKSKKDSKHILRLIMRQILVQKLNFQIQVLSLILVPKTVKILVFMLKRKVNVKINLVW